jgi:hypothetical protein
MQPVGVHVIIPFVYITSAVAAVVIWGLRLDKDENATTSFSFVLYCSMLASGTSNIVAGTAVVPSHLITLLDLRISRVVTASHMGCSWHWLCGFVRNQCDNAGA